jgi:DNA-directed RNA polymerase subunit RPC12/RpoP
MSEFKYACPVCGQHMMCDASQGGSVMECPTCFQKIVAPQAPAADAKFILTGTKLTEKKINVRVDGPVAVVQEKPFPLAVFIVLVLVVVAGAAGFFIYRAKHSPPPAPPATVKAPAKKIDPPKPSAPPASDANWMLTLNTNEIPGTPVAGRIHAQDFLIERATFQNGTLTLRAGQKGAVEFGALINFGGAQAESLSGQAINVAADTDQAAKISLRWKDAAGEVQKAEYDSGYALRLEFGALERNRLPGKIWLCLPDPEKSYLLGSFKANVSKPKPPK